MLLLLLLLFWLKVCNYRGLSARYHLNMPAAKQVSGTMRELFLYLMCLGAGVERALNGLCLDYWRIYGVTKPNGSYQAAAAAMEGCFV